MASKKEYLSQLVSEFSNNFGEKPHVVSFAPGRIEILGNHTDYNQGWVLSSAIDLGIFFLASKRSDSECHLIARDLNEKFTFSVDDDSRTDKTWTNFVKGIFVLLQAHKKTNPEEKKVGFNCLFSGDLPRGAGLSSSAALQMSCGLALARLYQVDIAPLDLAKLGQKVENQWVGVMSGLLDQFSSLFGKRNKLVLSDFRKLEATNVDLGQTDDLCFLILNTKVHHTLVDSEYNSRRQDCESASKYFSSAISSHPVHSLRDVSWEEWKEHSEKMEVAAAKRAAHIIGEDERVLEGKKILEAGEVKEFGKLMYQSHESSQKYFENSCPELDVLVAEAKKLPADKCLGARLSGGGFGGSIVALVTKKDSLELKKTLEERYLAVVGKSCESFVMLPADGAHLLSSF